MNQEEKQPLPIQNLEIKIDGNSSVPQIVLNGFNFRDNKIGLKTLEIIWGTEKDGTPESLIRVNYMKQDAGQLREIVVEQSFPNTLLKQSGI